MSHVKEEFKDKEQDWYDNSKLTKIQFDEGERGWAIDLGDGTYRLANNPINGMLAGKPHPNIPQWGDIVKTGPGDKLEVVKKWEGYNLEKEEEMHSEPTEAT